MPNPPSLDRALMQHLAELARLHISPERMPILRQRLERILAGFSALQGVITAASTPIAEASPRPLREDRASEPLPVATVLANAPESAGSSFLVPRVIDA